MKYYLVICDKIFEVTIHLIENHFEHLSKKNRHL